MKLNKWLNGALPALFIHSCIGSVYCWSLLKGDIAESMGTSVSSIELAFSLAIFFLGMSAAFCGRFVEKNVKRSSMLSTLCFSIGNMVCDASFYFFKRARPPQLSYSHQFFNTRPLQLSYSHCKGALIVRYMSP
jgi:OFA family oxalate/formate antiporter-like MFS transporter